MKRKEWEHVGTMILRKLPNGFYTCHHHSFKNHTSSRNFPKRLWQTKEQNLTTFPWILSCSMNGFKLEKACYLVRYIQQHQRSPVGQWLSLGSTKPRPITSPHRLSNSPFSPPSLQPKTQQNRKNANQKKPRFLILETTFSPLFLIHQVSPPHCASPKLCTRPSVNNTAKARQPNTTEATEDGCSALGIYPPWVASPQTVIFPSLRTKAKTLSWRLDGGKAGIFCFWRFDDFDGKSHHHHPCSTVHTGWIN